MIVLPALFAPGAFGAGASVATSATGPSGSSGPAGSTGLVAKLSACHADPLTANRYAIFAAQMTQIPGTRTMAISLLLEERGAKAPAFAVVAAPGFGSWDVSQPSVGVFTDNHEVKGLPAPAAFRVLVRARWIDRRHHVIRHETILSPVCVQPLLTPDLSIGTPLSRAAGPAPGKLTYSVVVRNDGTAAAGPFQVSLSVGGVALAPVLVSGLSANSTQLVQFTGPRCAAGSSVVATADPASSVIEPANANRTRSFACR